MNEKKCDQNEKLSIKDFLAQDVEQDGIDLMINEKVVPHGVSMWM